jgi:putative intracellular protease/amidase
MREMGTYPWLRRPSDGLRAGLIDALASGKPLAVVCPAPAALRATVADDETTPFACDHRERRRVADVEQRAA